MTASKSGVDQPTPSTVSGGIQAAQTLTPRVFAENLSREKSPSRSSVPFFAKVEVKCPFQLITSESRQRASLASRDDFTVCGLKAARGYCKTFGNFIT